MVDQTKMNGRHNESSPAAGVGRNLADLSHDLLTLAELQGQLFMVDLAEGKSRSILPLVLIVVGSLLALGALPILLLAFGWMLVNLAGMSEHAAFFIVSIAALVTAAAAAWIGYRMLGSALAVLSRSRQELKQNLQWIKTALKRQGTAARFTRS